MSERCDGTVVWFNNLRGFGFIRSDRAEKDIFVHYSKIAQEGYKTLKADQRVTYLEGYGPSGLQAEDVRPVAQA